MGWRLCHDLSRARLRRLGGFRRRSRSGRPQDSCQRVCDPGIQVVNVTELVFKRVVPVVELRSPVCCIVNWGAACLSSYLPRSVSCKSREQLTAPGLAALPTWPGPLGRTASLGKHEWMMGTSTSGEMRKPRVVCRYLLIFLTVHLSLLETCQVFPSQSHPWLACFLRTSSRQLSSLSIQQSAIYRSCQKYGSRSEMTVSFISRHHSKRSKKKVAVHKTPISS